MLSLNSMHYEAAVSLLILIICLCDIVLTHKRHSINVYPLNKLFVFSKHNLFNLSRERQTEKNGMGNMMIHVNIRPMLLKTLRSRVNRPCHIEEASMKSLWTV